mmetsp:Transcript_6333/g.26233  ORF Transcript_6333/g.26233 Transcript_6333/m.26233 type:complete len:212 (-) Transcript_6333:1004-1639(-)
MAVTGALCPGMTLSTTGASPETAHLRTLQSRLPVKTKSPDSPAPPAMHSTVFTPPKPLGLLRYLFSSRYFASASAAAASASRTAASSSGVIAASLSALAAAALAAFSAPAGSSSSSSTAGTPRPSLSFSGQRGEYARAMTSPLPASYTARHASSPPTYSPAPSSETRRQRTAPRSSVLPSAYVDISAVSRAPESATGGTLQRLHVPSAEPV